MQRPGLFGAASTRIGAAFFFATIGACSPADDDQRVVLYSSVDDYVLAEVLLAFEVETGIRVKTVGDTEATKTTGLVLRLLAEREQPRADVWWSSEPFGTIRLAREGVLGPYTSPQAEAAFPANGWPESLRDPGGAWYGFAQRARVLAYSPARAEDPPATLAELTEPRWRGRIGMARPRFGTTRGHMAWLAAAWGEEAFEAWLLALKGNGLRLYDGNATIVRAIRDGEIDVGLTDTDDVLALRTTSTSVLDAPQIAQDQADALGRWPDPGRMVIPNTIALVSGGPNPDGASRLIDWILEGNAERIIAASPSGNVPVHPVVLAELGLGPQEPTRGPSLLDAASAEERAMAICERVLGP